MYIIMMWSTEVYSGNIEGKITSTTYKKDARKVLEAAIDKWEGARVFKVPNTKKNMQSLKGSRTINSSNFHYTIFMLLGALGEEIKDF